MVFELLVVLTPRKNSRGVKLVRKLSCGDPPRKNVSEINARNLVKSLVKTSRELFRSRSEQLSGGFYQTFYQI